jgi:hypothetical protein
MERVVHWLLEPGRTPLKEALSNSIWLFIASAAKQSSALIKQIFLDCRVASLLAKTD